MFFISCRKVLRINKRLCRFYSLDFTHVNSDNIHESGDVIDSSFNIDRVRRDSDKSLRIAILGLPNAGKSTLVNQLAQRHICAMSGKVHTTRTKTNVIYTENETQLVFIDTPGLVTERDFKKLNLEPAFKLDVKESLDRADIVGVIHDASHPRNDSWIDRRVIKVLEDLKTGVPSILIMNKVDRVKDKRKLLKLATVLTSEKNWPNFSDIFMISALENDGVDDLRSYLVDSAKPRDWEFSPDTITDELTEKIIERTVKAKFMDALPSELPYSIRTETEYLGILEDGSMSAIVNIFCPSDRICRLAMGCKGGRVKEVAITAEQELSNAFRTAVRLKLAVQFSTKTRDREIFVKN